MSHLPIVARSSFRFAASLAFAMLSVFAEAAEPGRPAKMPELELVITVDNKKATGFVELSKQFPGDISGKSVELEKAFSAALIPVQKGQRLRLKVDVKIDGELRDVTADPSLHVEFALGQMTRLRPDEIAVQPEEGAPVVKRDGLIRMTVAYRQASSGKVGFNEVVFKLVR